MGKRLAIAFAVVGLVLVAGYLAYTQIFSDDAEPEKVAQPVIDAGSPPDSPAPPVVAIKVVSMEGTVERQGPDGEWKPIEFGDRINRDDVVRTGADGSLEFDLDGQIIGLDSNTTLELPKLTSANLLRLDQGRVSASVSASGKPVRVEVPGSDAVAETAEGEFDVLAQGDQTTVATRSGEVDFEAAGKKIKVTKGKQSTVKKGNAPTAAVPIPKSLFLKVGRAAKTRTKTHTVRGKTTPGAIISINGVVVRVGESGEFSKVVALAEGRNNVEIVGRDVLGRTKKTTARIVVDSKAPSVGGQMKWGE